MAQNNPHQTDGDAALVAPAATPTFVIGIALLLVAIAASLALVLASFNAIGLPGCGEGSGCAEAARSAWGKIPGLGWPLSSVGVAYFAGLLVAFILERGRLPGTLRMLVRLGTLGSVVLVAVMFTNGYVCKYCLAVHAANLGFWLLAELIEPRPAHVLRAAGALVLVFALAITTLTIVEGRVRRVVAEQAESERQQSTQQILDAPAADRYAFTGRYNYGPDVAPMHIVMFTDYQCPDCNKIEDQVERLFAERNDISLSVKQFPFCVDCNPRITNNLHPNACWAARAAEAAGKLGGNDAFWDTHFWLFKVDGYFQEPELRAHVESLGLDYDTFVATMKSPEIDALIKADIEEGTALGLHYTPMIFINGVQVRGVAAADKLYQTVYELALRNPQPRLDATPPPAREKYLEDWREQPVRNFGHDFVPHVRGSDSPRLDILVWLDYLVEPSATFDAMVKRIMAGRDDVRYTVRQYPVNPNCNPHVQPTYHELSCEASKAVEAAGQIGGEPAFWAMHDWVLQHQGIFTRDSIREGAAAIGLDPDALVAMMDDDAVTLALQEDMDAGATQRFRGIPACYINGKYVPRIFLDDDCLLDDIASEVLGVDLRE